MTHKQHRELWFKVISFKEKSDPESKEKLLNFLIANANSSLLNKVIKIFEIDEID